MRKDLLIEIGTEEIPAGYVPPAVKAFTAGLSTRLAEERIAFETVESFATPRRLALRVASVETMQPDRKREVTGPPKRVAFDKDGNPTKAAIGFAKTQGVSVEDLRTVETEKGEYLAVTVTDTGRRTAEILSGLVPELLASLVFPRTMRWEPSGFRFARPIRWIVALLGKDIVPVEVAGVKSGRESRGHRILHPDPVVLAEPSLYEDALLSAGVVVSPTERRERIREEIQRVLRDKGWTVLEDPELLETVNYLVEMPHAVCGGFEESYLEIPDRVVITAMRSHQKYFSIVDGDGKLLPGFVTISNGISDHEDEVRAGNERVLRARLADARFYWDEDRSVSLFDRVENLGRMVWQEGMGSLLDKTVRMERIAGEIADETNPAVRESAVRAARLAKADLTTEMIRDGKEFTALQGYIGMEYARASGEPDDVAAAIHEQYLPRFSGDVLPKSPAGIILSITDRIDTLIGCFGAGLIPSGSQDPYALRRQALGIVRILAEEKIPIPLNTLLAIGIRAYGDRLSEPEKVRENLLRFFRQRIVKLLTGKGLPYDVVDAVLETGLDHPADLERRAEAIRDFRESESFEKLVLGLKRVMNILKGVDISGEADRSLFREEEETGLCDTVESIRDKYEKALESADYRCAMEMLLELRGPIDAFFDKVLVMDKDEAIRANRIALLGGTAHLFHSLADLSKVVIEGEK